MNSTAPNAITNAALSARQVTAIQHALKLSDTQMVEALGMTPASGIRRLRRWKTGAEEPSGSAAKLLLMLYKMDSALRVLDCGEWDRAHEMFRNIVPDFMQ